MHDSDRARALVCPRGAATLAFILSAGLIGACGDNMITGDTGGGGAGGGGSGGGSTGGDQTGGGGDGSGGGVGGGQLPESGTVHVTLVPGPSVAVGSPVTVSFGAPFPPGLVTDVGLLAAHDASGAELPIHADETLPWRVWPGRDATESVRAAMVSVQVTFATRDPLEIDLAWGAAPTATMPAPADPRAGWVAVTDGEFPNGTVREPPVYAAFPSDWLSSCLLRSRTLATDSDTSWSWMDDAFLSYAHTAVNEVPAAVTERIDYVNDYEPWLFDRSMTLFGAYARTGDVSWLRHAHRSAQFYLQHVDAAGYFDIKGGTDLKYSYGRSLLVDYIFTGDPALLAGIQRVAKAGEDWDPTYDINRNFWTERHQTYALLAALVAWEATGTTHHADRTRYVATTSFNLALHPANGWPAQGCMLHTMDSHEGAGGTDPICSPWMSGLFADAVWEYFVQTADPKALRFLADLGGFVAKEGLYPGGDGIAYTVPWYLASQEKQFSDDGPWGDIEHTCDVSGVLARGSWAAEALGEDPSPLSAAAADLLKGCKYDLDMWHRPGSTADGLAEWRLSPARKFNWWFGSTNDMSWLMTTARAQSAKLSADWL